MLRDRLIASSPRHAEVLARGRALRGAVNQAMSDDSTPVPEGAEVAFFPPVTGG
jgi:molybdopterin synthase sulfur carrier subunit